MPLLKPISSIQPLAYIACVLGSGCQFNDDENTDLDDSMLGYFLIKSKRSSSHLHSFLTDFSFLYNKRNSLKAFFSDIVANWVTDSSAPLNDTELAEMYFKLREEYNKLYEDYATSKRDEFSYYVDGGIMACQELNLSEEVITKISKKTISLKRFPVAYALDCYFRSLDEEYKEFIFNKTCAYLGPTSQKRYEKYLKIGDKANSLIRSFSKIIKNIISYRDYELYCDLSPEDINASEGTSFSQSLIKQLKYYVCEMRYPEDGEYFKKKGIRNYHNYLPAWLYFSNCDETHKQDVYQKHLSSEQALYKKLKEEIDSYAVKSFDKSIDIQPYFVHQIEGPHLVITTNKRKELINIEDSDNAVNLKLFANSSNLRWYEHFYYEHKDKPITWKYQSGRYVLYILPGKWEASPISHECKDKIKDMIKDFDLVTLIGTRVIFMKKADYIEPYDKLDRLHQFSETSIKEK